eukprot:16448050-Heterocapsa_arctica.AAC.1
MACSFLPVIALEALISFMGIGPKPPWGSSHGSFQISFHPSANKLAILLGAHCQVPSWSLTPAMGSGAPSLAYRKALLA